MSRIAYILVKCLSSNTFDILPILLAIVQYNFHLDRKPIKMAHYSTKSAKN